MALALFNTTRGGAGRTINSFCVVVIFPFYYITLPTLLAFVH